MRVTSTKSKNSESFYINYAYIDKNGKSTSRIYKKLGTLRDLKEMLGTDDRDEVMKWAREQARIATEQHKAESESIQVTLLRRISSVSMSSVPSTVAISSCRRSAPI